MCRVSIRHSTQNKTKRINLEYILDFLQNPIQKTKIYPHLKCSEEEANILKYMLKLIFQGLKIIMFIKF